MIDGFYAKGNEITKGKWFTWSWGQGKNAGEIEEDFGGLYADYEFKDASSTTVRDSFGATWGYRGKRCCIESWSIDAQWKGPIRRNFLQT